MVWFLCLRLQQRNIERAMDITDSFTWEDLPTRDADFGQLTAAGWIPKLNVFNMRATIMMTVTHLAQSTIRILTNHETIYIVWYPFDWNVTPFYELIIISQVKIFTNYVKNGFNVLHHVAFAFSEETCRYFYLQNLMSRW